MQNFLLSCLLLLIAMGCTTAEERERCREADLVKKWERKYRDRGQDKAAARAEAYAKFNRRYGRDPHHDD